MMGWLAGIYFVAAPATAIYLAETQFEKGTTAHNLMGLLFFSPILWATVIFCLIVGLDIWRMSRTNFDTMSDEVLREHVERHERGEW